MVTVVFEHGHWLEGIRNHNVFGDEDKGLPSPFAKLQAISNTYFPQFNDKISELEDAEREYKIWIFGAGQKRLRGEIENLSKGGADAYKVYGAKRDELLRDLRDFGKEEFQ
jgi:hypothetical protein